MKEGKIISTNLDKKNNFSENPILVNQEKNVFLLASFGLHALLSKTTGENYQSNTHINSLRTTGKESLDTKRLSSKWEVEWKLIRVYIGVNDLLTKMIGWPAKATRKTCRIHAISNQFCMGRNQSFQVHGSRFWQMIRYKDIFKSIILHVIHMFVIGFTLSKNIWTRSFLIFLKIHLAS